MTDSIFNGEDQSPNPNKSTTNSDDQLGTLLAEIKNERGEQKYKSVQDAIVALKHAQEFIPQLKSEKDASTKELEDLRQRLNEMESLKDTVQKLTQKQNDPPPKEDVLDDEKVAQLIDQRLTQRQQQQLYEQNINQVAKSLSEKFGKDKAEELFYGKAQELGLSKEDINSLAAKSPQAVLQMFGVTAGAHKQPNFSPANTKLRSEGFQETPPSFIGRETEPTPIGAGYDNTRAKMENAKRMVEELDQAGLSIHDLTDPKTFFKYFNK